MDHFILICLLSLCYTSLSLAVIQYSGIVLLREVFFPEQLLSWTVNNHYGVPLIPDGNVRLKDIVLLFGEVVSDEFVRFSETSFFCSRFFPFLGSV